MHRRVVVPVAVLVLLVLSLLLAPSTFTPPGAQAAPNEAPTVVGEDEALSIALAHVRSQAGALNLTAADLADLQAADLYTGDIGLTYVYLLQHVNSLPIHNALINVTVGADGRVIHTGNRGEANIAARANSATPVLTPAEAIAAAATALGLPQPQGLTVLEPAKGVTQTTVFSTGGISLEAIPVSLVYQPTAAGALQLAWNLSIYELDAQHWWSVRVDAATGALLAQDDWVIHDHWDLAGPLSMSKMPGPRFSMAGPGRFAGETYAAPMTPDAYRVFALPVESPNHGGRTLATNPANALASPFGWHDTNGAAGAEFTTTQGNNAHGYTDTDANNTPDAGSSPDGGPTLVFDFPLDLTQAPSAYRPAAVTNLFYWNNITHDLNYQYGFTEAARNFQENNYGRGGIGSDYVNAEAQDGSGTNNANFASNADGTNGRMQMYLWTAPTPDRDGDLDNGIILHEYGHGVSNRQTGTGVGCLSNAEQMGEGWSDWQSLIFTARPTDTATMPRGVGTYALNQPTNGPGIREFPYSTDMTINTHTYNRTRTAAAPHGVGSVWTAMLWEVYWNFVAQYGFDANFYTGTGGNNRIIRLVNEGLKLQPCSPGFVDGRNAILAADQAINNGANQCLIWRGFAKRGLGFSATQGASTTNTDNTEAFDLPQACIGPTPTPTRTVTGTPPTSTPTTTRTSTPSATATPNALLCRTPNVPIPDSPAPGVTDTLTVALPGNISDLNVSIQAAHTWVGDLVFTLRNSTTGATAVIIDRPGVPAAPNGCSGDNINATLDDEAGSPVENACAASVPTINGTFSPNNPLSVFDGQPLAGTWTLRVQDFAGADIGTLNQWCLLPTTGQGGSATPTTTTTRTPTAGASATMTRTPTAGASATVTRTPTAGTGPDITISPTAITEMHPAAGTTTQRILTIGNVGTAPLTWTIYEETEPQGYVPAAVAPNPNADQAAAAESADSAAALPNPAPDGRPSAPFAPEAVLYNNGPLVNSPGTGPGGADESILQTSLGLNTLGAGHAVSSGFRVADDFTVTDASGWQVDSFVFYAYQTGSTTTSTINNVNFRIWNGVPGAAGSVVVFGDTTTNRLASTAFANIYRRSDTTPGDTSRPVMVDRATAGVTLPAGTYWLDWQTGGTLASGPWAPPISINGQAATGNALQFNPGTGAWTALVDTGTAAAPQGLPFLVEGTVLGGGACNTAQNIPWLTVAPTNGTTAPGGSSNVTLTFNSTSLANGTYTGDLCIESNDLDEAQTRVPVTLVVGPVTAIQIGDFDQAPATPLRPLLLGLAGLAGLALTAGLRRQLRTR